jgi:hypothetical protein
LAQFATDHSDDVRWAVLDLVQAAVERKLVTPVLQASFTTELSKLVTGADEGSPRIARRAAELLSGVEWALASEEKSPAIMPVLADEFFVDKKHFVRRRAAKT